VLAARLLGLLDEAGHAVLLQQVVDGKLRLALAHEELGRDTFAPRATMAQRKGESWVLRGHKLLAAGVPGANVLLLTAADSEGRTRIFRVPADTAGLHAHPCQLADGSHAADLTFDELELPTDTLVAGEHDVEATLHVVLASGIVALCWEASGTMQAALEQTASYTQQRQQFGQALARFQVVQHRLAEMAVYCEEARAACELAALRLDMPGTDAKTALTLASLAKSKVGRCARVISQEAVQLHGGMGVCEELPVAAMFRKLSAFGQQFGAAALHSERYGATLLASGHWRASQTLLEPGSPAA
jgi:alkylation response protein AidB-like acyl-CoA dehydrogenase